MEYIKYIALVVGLVSLMYARSSYTKRNQNDQSVNDYTTLEKTANYVGYACLVIAVISVIVFN